MNYTIRPCRSLGELAACVSIQKRTWGYSDRELYPLRLFVNIPKIGGHVLGAFARGGRMVGFVASMPAWRRGRRYYHSLSLGVLPGHQNRGLGRALKLRQRREAMRAGIDLIELTFDPLVARNAFFNIVRLGAIARRYLPDYYGRVESRLQGDLPSDRLVAEWWLTSKRVRQALSGKPTSTECEGPSAEVPIPSDFAALHRAGPKAARAQQTLVRKQFEKHFARGWTVTGFIRDRKRTRYLLTPYED